MPEIFRARTARTPQRRRVLEPNPSSPRERGYDARWDRESRAYRQQNPFCALCREKGRLTFATLVDHKHPVAEGGAVHDPANWWGLCVAHHALKRRWEDHAHETDQVHLIVRWCDEPTTRPRFRGDLS